jgi:hypothetical protein
VWSFEYFFPRLVSVIIDYKKNTCMALPSLQWHRENTTEKHNITHTRQTKTDTQINTYIYIYSTIFTLQLLA